MSSNEIKIKITEELKDDRKQVGKLFKDVAAAGGFSGQHGQTRKHNIEASLAGIDAIFEKGNLSLSDVKELNIFFKNLYESLGKAAANTSQMSKELSDLIDQQVKTIDKLNEKRQQQIDLLKEGKFDKASNKFTSTKDSVTVLKEIGAFKQTKSGEASKRGEVNLSNIIKNMEAGVTYFDKNNKNLADNPAFKEQIEKIKNLNKQNDDLTKTIAKYEKALQKATQQIEQQTSKDAKKTGINSLPSRVVSNQVKNTATLGSLGELAAQQENASKFSTEEFSSLPQLKEQSSALRKAFKQFSIYTLAVNNARKALNSAIATVKDLDRYLTEQSMVTGKSRKEVFGLVKTYQSLATQYNATTKEVAEVNTEFMRQGKSMKESTQLTEAALASARVAGISGAESVNYLTTALNGFQLAAKEAMKVSDKFAAVAAASATSYEEIAVALSKVASQANTAGMSIDYTTALLSKGIETTKEAPETIGTALKTVIARMRELGDYGETLSGDTDINNVETQLAYVGIELKNANGELRSTEDVLDELGRKWDTLSNNQQAAVAKALAGTRQQSRLIAMMSDYERVIELQAIAQRSQGSTLAQMSSLMTGLDASLNEVAIAWESIISSLVNNDFVVAWVDSFADIMNFIKNIASNIGGQIAIYTTLGALAGVWLNKEREKHKINELERQQQRIFMAEQAEDMASKKQKEIEDLENEQANLAVKQQELFLEESKTIEKQNQEVSAAKALIDEEQKLVILREQEITLLRQKETLTALEQQRLDDLTKQNEASQQNIQHLEEEKQKAEELLATNQQILAEKQKQSPEYQANAQKMQINKGKIDLKKDQKSQFEKIAKQNREQFLWQSKINNSIAKRIPLVGSVLAGFEKMKSATKYLGSEEFKNYALKVKEDNLTKKNLKDQKKKNLLKAGETAASTANLAVETATTAQDQAQTILSAKDLALAIAKKALESLTNPMFWIPIAIAGMTVLLKFVKKLFKSTEDAVKEINELSAANYKLNEQTTAIQSLISQYEKLDKQVIKTAADQEEMNKLLAEAGEKLDDEQKKYYETLGTEGKLKYLKGIEEKNRKDMEANYKTQLENIKSKPDTLNDLNSQAVLESMNNYYIGDVIDSLTDLTDEDKLALEKFTQNMVTHMDDKVLIKWADEKGHETIAKFVDQVKAIESNTIEGNDSIFNILNSEDYGWEDQVKAYQKALGQLTGDVRHAFESLYKTQYDFLGTLGKDTLAYFDELALTGQQINDLYGSFESIKNNDITKNLGLNENDYKTKVTEVMSTLATSDRTLGEAVEDAFSEQLSNFKKGTQEYADIVNAFVTTIGKSMEIGSLNMGQNIEKFENRISAIYEKATQWSSLTESEKTQFLNDYQDLFKGNADLAEAFEQGNYEMIRSALMGSDILNKEYKKIQADIERDLDYQRSLQGDARNESYIKYLEEQKEFYAQKDKLFKISLEFEKEQQDAQLDAYKDYLQKQQDALTESLEKQKEAYEKYFDQINQVAEDEDYEEKAELLVSNISKLSGSNAATEAKRADLEKKLEDLEKERLQELRERAQEQIISNIEDEIEAISDKFDKLLDSNQAMLLALTGDIQSPEEFAAKMISTEISSGANTALDIQSFLNSLQSNFGMLTSGYDFSKLDIKEDENKNLILNVNGTTYNLTTAEEKNLFDIIMTALTQIGKF